MIVYTWLDPQQMSYHYSYSSFFGLNLFVHLVGVGLSLSRPRWQALQRGVKVVVIIVNDIRSGGSSSYKYLP